MQFSLLVRIGSGTPAVISAAVKSAVAAVVNKVGVGQPVSLSDVVTAAGKVAGVVSVVILSPAYGAGSDVVAIQPYEKPRVLSLDDVSVSFVGQ